ncbi:hypothetical protein J2Y67_002879 [Neobacillus niacini]|nr:hypothetical protein [Neobacillus niacini]
MILEEVFDHAEFFGAFRKGRRCLKVTKDKKAAGKETQAA